MQRETVAQMERLLEPLNPSWVAARVGVTRQQVDRWKNGKHVSAERLEEVADVVRQLLPEHRPEQPPPWTDELEARLREAIASGQMAQADQVASRMVERMIGELREHAPQLFGGDAPAGSASVG